MRASLLRSAANQAGPDHTQTRIALLEARVAMLTKALASLSFDLTLGFLGRKFDAELNGAAGRTAREKRLILEKLEHGNCFAFTKGNEHRIVEAECQEDAWRKVRLMEGWGGTDVACLGETKPGLRDHAA